MVFVTDFLHGAWCFQGLSISYYQYFIFFIMDTTLNGYNMLYLSIYQFMDFQIVPTFGLLRIVWLWTFVYKFYVDTCFHFMGISSRLLGHMITLCFTFWEIARMFSKGYIIHNPTSNVWGFQFFTFLPILVIICHFDYIHLCRYELISCVMDLDFQDR